MTKTALLLAAAITLGAGSAACAMPVANLAGVQQTDDLRQQVRVVCNKYGQCYHKRRNRAVYYYPSYRAYPRYYYVYPSYSYDLWSGHDYYGWGNYRSYYSDYYWYGNGWDY